MVDPETVVVGEPAIFARWNFTPAPVATVTSFGWTLLVSGESPAGVVPISVKVKVLAVTGFVTVYCLPATKPDRGVEPDGCSYVITSPLSKPWLAVVVITPPVVALAAVADFSNWVDEDQIPNAVGFTFSIESVCVCWGLSS